MTVPTFYSISDRTAHPFRTLRLWANAICDDGHQVNFSLLTAVPGANVTQDGFFTFMPAWNQLGNITITLRATDATMPGQADSSDETFAVTVANAPPAASVPDKVITPGTLFRYYLNASDPDGDALTFTKVAGPEALTVVTQDTRTGLITWTPTVANIGNHPVTVRVADPSGASTGWLNVSFSIQVVNQPPQVEPIPNYANAHPGREVAFYVNCPGGVMYTFQSNPVGAAMMGNRFSWTPAQAHVGTHNFTLRATDIMSGCHADVSFSITVANTAPDFEDLANHTVDEHTPLSFHLNASDAEGDPFSFSANGALPTGATLNGSGFFQWQDPTSGNYTVSVRVTDSFGAWRDRSFSIMVVD